MMGGGKEAACGGGRVRCERPYESPRIRAAGRSDPTHVYSRNQTNGIQQFFCFLLFEQIGWDCCRRFISHIVPGIVSVARSQRKSCCSLYHAEREWPTD